MDLATSVSSVSKEMAQLSENSQIFLDISNKADRAAALGPSNVLHNLPIFLFLLTLALALLLFKILPPQAYPVIIILLAVCFYFFWPYIPQSIIRTTSPHSAYDPSPGEAPCVFPSQLITQSASDKNAFELNEQLLENLTTLKGPYYIVGVVGLFRTGKSTALTLYMREVMRRENVTDTCLCHFGVGHTHIGHTEGVWAWFMPFHLLGPDYSKGRSGTLVILDMEGMADPLKANYNRVYRIFSFVALMSSSLIVHGDKNLNLNDLGQLVAVSELARYLGLQTATPGKSSTTMMLPDLNFFLLSNQLYAEAPGMRDGTFLITNEIEKILEGSHADTPSHQAQALKTLFPKRKGFASAVLGDGELEELRAIDRVPGIPQQPYSQSAIKIWRQIFADLSPKSFDGQEMDGAILSQYLRQVMTVIANNAQIDVNDFYRYFVNIAQNQTMALLAEEMSRIERNLPLVETQINRTQLTLKNNIQKAAMELNKKLSNIPQDLITEFKNQLNSVLEGHFTYLRKLNGLISTYEWVASAWQPCEGACPGARYRTVICMRGDNTTAADFKCEKGLKPSVNESCHLEDHFWKTGPWGDCINTCPGTKSRYVYCSRCNGSTPVPEDLCKGISRPAETEPCGQYSYSWREGDWSQCQCGQSRTRAVDCVRCDELKVGQTLCAAIPMPITSDSCGSCSTILADLVLFVVSPLFKRLFYFILTGIIVWLLKMALPKPLKENASTLVSGLVKAIAPSTLQRYWP